MNEKTSPPNLTDDVERLSLELFETASLCRPKVAKSLIETGANVNWRDNIAVKALEEAMALRRWQVRIQ